MTARKQRTPSPGETWSRGGIDRRVLSCSEGRVIYQVDLAPARLERHACSLATWGRWAAQGAEVRIPASPSLFGRL